MILIVGDSWGCGEWPQRYTGPNDVLHTGLSRYIKESGRDVINLSRAGSSNKDTLETVHRFFDSGISRYLVSPVKNILVFQTEWYRDFSPATYHIDFDTSLIDPIDDKIYQRFMSQFYYGLRDIAKKHGVTINLIGGASDTVWLDRFSDEYPGVSIACQSFTNLCINDCHRVEKENFSISSKAADFLKSHTQDHSVIALIECLIDNTLRRQELWDANPDYFFPDGKHANRNAHKKLFDFLIDTQVII